jgi:hypothetical protein
VSLHFFIQLIYITPASSSPQHKLAYFKTQGWEESWVNTAYNIVHEEYDHLYALPHLNNSSDGDDNYIAVCSVDSVCDFSP